MDIFTAIFDCVRQMAWSVTFVIPIVLIARWCLGKISSHMCYLLWGIVAVRLLCPVLLPSDVSIFYGIGLIEDRIQTTAAGWLPEAQRPPEHPDTLFREQKLPEPPDTVLRENGNVNPDMDSGTKEEAASEEKAVCGTRAEINWKYYVWLTGLSGMLGYAVSSCLFLRRKLQFATMLRDRVYESDVAGSPFVFGVIRPKIYLPYHLPERELDYILMHERYHIQRKDHLIKWLAYILLAVYWFHPLVWAAYFLMNQDMEASCDEYVLKDRGIEERKEYGRILLRFSGGTWDYLAVGLVFGERSIKSRMNHILHQKKRTIWSMAAALAFLVMVSIICLTDSRNTSNLSVANGENTEAGTEETAQVIPAALELFEAANPYIGDASANGRLLGMIATYNGGLEQKFTTELQTSEEPYVLTLHFEREPDETKMWKNAILFLALTENCGEVHWDYPATIATAVTSIPGTEKNAPEEENPVQFEPYETDTMITFYVSVEDANENLGVDNIKEYAASAQKVEELLAMLGGAVDYSCKGTVLMPTGEENFYMQITTKESRALYQIESASGTGADFVYVMDGPRYILGSPVENDGIDGKTYSLDGSAELDGTESGE